MNVSRVMASTAGTESTAKIMSIASAATRARNSGVVFHFPPRFTQNAPPAYSCCTGATRWASRTSQFFSGWIVRSPGHSIFSPTRKRIAPNTYTVK